tara:strand:- start:1232 stop:2176 length:945 start_codon:yes stop_codon:yes gene_type:complete
MQKPTEILWDTKYRPQTIDACILPAKNKQYFKNIIAKNKIPNLLLCSSMPGTGKTTVARAICNEMNFDTLFVNASEQSGVDVLRTLIRDHVSSFSLDGNEKVVILDEFDQASDSFQKAFRGFTEEFPSSRFILTANYSNKVIKPIRSRMTVVEFTVPESDRKDLIKQSAIRCLEILKKEGIPVSSNKIIVELVRNSFPDNRSIIVELQRYSTNGEIDEGILGKLVPNDDISELCAAMKSNKFSEVRHLIPAFASDYPNFINALFRKGEHYMEKNSIGDFILYLGRNQESANDVVNMELHISALVVELMGDIRWK